MPRWLTRSSVHPSGCAPPEVPWLRLVGFATLVAFVVAAFTTTPRAGFQGRGLLVLAGTAVFAVAMATSVPMHQLAPERRLRRLALACAVALGLLALQPDALWVLTPYVAGSVGGSRLPRRSGTLLFVADLAATVAIAAALGREEQALSVVVGSVVFFLFMRLLSRTREEHERATGLLRALERSRAAEAQAAAEAERSRLAREMHDVLAHSLSALALQLESTRLLAADRGTDPEVASAIERAHGLAASGLQEARRAIGALRGDELPGPQRLPALVEASGLPVSLDLSGRPRELAPDARLAVYRTAQEALTNVRRHSRAEHVELRLDYRDDATVLTVADHGPPPAANGTGPGGYGLTGMRERAELLGGRLTAAPTRDGFHVELWLPA